MLDFDKPDLNTLERIEFVGVISIDELTGTLTMHHFEAGEPEPSCEWQAPLIEMSPNDTCSFCDFGWDLSFGAPEIALEGAVCSDFLMTVEGIWSVAQKQNTPFVGKSGDWSLALGTSTVDEGVWTFVLYL